MTTTSAASPLIKIVDLKVHFDLGGGGIFSRLMGGAQVSMIVGVGTATLSSIIGVMLGLLAGFYRGWVDSVISLLINVFYGIPDLLVALILITVLSLGKPGLDKIIIAISVTRWMDMTRLVRGQTLALREREFIEAARAAGAKPLKILFGHIFPNALGPVIVTPVLLATRLHGTPLLALGKQELRGIAEPCAVFTIPEA